MLNGMEYLKFWEMLNPTVKEWTYPDSPKGEQIGKFRIEMMSWCKKDFGKSCKTFTTSKQDFIAEDLKYD